MRILAEAVKGRELRFGDLFSQAGQFYWDNRLQSIGEKVYIRTEAPLPLDQENEDTYRITIEK